MALIDAGCAVLDVLAPQLSSTDRRLLKAIVGVLNHSGTFDTLEVTPRWRDTLTRPPATAWPSGASVVKVLVPPRAGR